MISILILTLNEENNLPACLETCKWSDDIRVLQQKASPSGWPSTISIALRKPCFIYSVFIAFYEYLIAGKTGVWEFSKFEGKLPKTLIPGERDEPLRSQCRRGAAALRWTRSPSRVLSTIIYSYIACRFAYAIPAFPSRIALRTNII